MPSIETNQIRLENRFAKVQEDAMYAAYRYNPYNHSDNSVRPVGTNVVQIKSDNGRTQPYRVREIKVEAKGLVGEILVPVKPIPGQPAQIYVNWAGTHDMPTIMADLETSAGEDSFQQHAPEINAMISKAIEDVVEVTGHPVDLSFNGHSLGGGLAQRSFQDFQRCLCHHDRDALSEEHRTLLDEQERKLSTIYHVNREPTAIGVGFSNIRKMKIGTYNATGVLDEVAANCDALAKIAHAQGAELEAYFGHVIDDVVQATGQSTIFAEMDPDIASVYMMLKELPSESGELPELPSGVLIMDEQGRIRQQALMSPSNNMLTQALQDAYQYVTENGTYRIKAHTYVHFNDDRVMNDRSGKVEFLNNRDHPERIKRHLLHKNQTLKAITNCRRALSESLASSYDYYSYMADSVSSLLGTKTPEASFDDVVANERAQTMMSDMKHVQDSMVELHQLEVQGKALALDAQSEAVELEDGAGADVDVFFDVPDMAPDAYEVSPLEDPVDSELESEAQEVDGDLFYDVPDTVDHLQQVSESEPRASSDVSSERGENKENEVNQSAPNRKRKRSDAMVSSFKRKRVEMEPDYQALKITKSSPKDEGPRKPLREVENQDQQKSKTKSGHRPKGAGG